VHLLAGLAIPGLQHQEPALAPADPFGGLADGESGTLRTIGRVFGNVAALPAAWPESPRTPASEVAYFGLAMRSLAAVSDWVLGAATLAVGALLTTATNLAVEAIKRHWSRSDAASAHQAETKRRADEQSEAAARQIVMDISEIRSLYAKHPITYTNGGWQGGPGASRVDPIAERIASRAVDVRHPEVRRRLELAVEALQSLAILPHVVGDSESSIVWRSTDVARNAIGAMLRGEALPDDAGVLEEYRQSLFDAFAEPENGDQVSEA
jgi:hypothetical protein